MGEGTWFLPKTSLSWPGLATEFGLILKHQIFYQGHLEYAFCCPAIQRATFESGIFPPPLSSASLPFFFSSPDVIQTAGKAAAAGKGGRGGGEETLKSSYIATG